MHRLNGLKVVVFFLEAVSAAALVVSFVVLGAWNSPHLQGAGPGYKYLAIGLATHSGVSFSSLGSDSVVNLQPIMPTNLGLATSVRERINISRRPGRNAVATKVELVVGRYSEALHLTPLCGRLITLQDQRIGASVAVLSRSVATKLFGDACSAVNRDIYTSKGFKLKVVGIISDKFKGLWTKYGGATATIWAPYTLMIPLAQGAWPKGLPTANMFDEYVFSGTTAVLSVPNSTSDAQLQTLLSQLFRNAKGILPSFAVGLATAQPYSPQPDSQEVLSHRISLAFGLSLATFILSSINLVLMGWLRYLSRRPTLYMERVLGARRSHMMLRYAQASLATIFWLGSAVLLLTVFGVVVLRHLVPSLSSVLNASSLLIPLLRTLPIVVILAAIVQLLPLQILLSREGLDNPRSAPGSPGDRAFGAMLLICEVALGMVMSVLAVWAVVFAWRSAHEEIGFFSRPATIFELASSNSLDLGQNRMTRAANILVMRSVAAEVRRTVSGAESGIGPPVHPGNDDVFPGSVSVGTTSIKACGYWATPGWLNASRVTIVAGSGFRNIGTGRDQILLDARLANRLFGSPLAAVGQSVWTPAYSADPQRIVGVVASVYMNGLKSDVCPVVFYDLRSSPLHLIGSSHSLIVASELSSQQRVQLRERLTSLFEREHAGLAVQNVRSVTQTRNWLAAHQIAESRVFTVIALLAWVIALSGIVALLRLFLVQRRRLLAIESALGATPRRTYFGVILGTLAVAGIGAIIALLLVPWLATQYALLSGAQVTAFGWATWIALTVLLLAVFTVAHFPARRAARAEPAQSLHEL